MAKNSKHDGKCNGVGTIWSIGATGTYIKGVQCTYEADFKDGGRYEKGGWFSRDKSKDYLPCMRNDFNEGEKKRLCLDNPFLLYTSGPQK